MPQVGELIDAGIAGLLRADADALWDLAGRAQMAELPPTAAECQAAAGRLRVLRQLLRLTRRNLQVLRAIGRHTDLYAETGN